ncbi:hypothetical protein VAE055_420222 [Vibrio aestuarianus]|uniref:Uncharacterized protein n=1 Tax=Vibrio aestuarianus TaxID=28171 RepID=A0ABN8TMU5_9VIBR|nr:hypothetical protein VAE063_1000221 [Vibrio aestuarianus]CAH8220344.1 hypothetical protein VIBAE_B10307 [Vibrio aestuarianus subsp. francensis]CAH8221878.1 hypothetical protein VAE055_420222 [Vibrio aestuarianus]CAH8222343.1 hypothetical protein VAE115_370219 [Vibrio aestuarianus]CAH8229873.1 hypothetical protein VAE142_930222 [Vibrio aestuarianus]
MVRVLATSHHRIDEIREHRIALSFALWLMIRPHICFIPLKESIPADICALYYAEGNNKTQQFIQSITAKS